MKTYLYLSLVPESLIASMLPPEGFGSYYAVGNKKRTRGQALFFEVDPSLLDEESFPMEEIEKGCRPHEDGRPKNSLYLSIYRALEHVPTSALKRLYLVTEDGRVLGLDPKPHVPSETPELHLYQELCPVTPRVVSKLDPDAFTKFITDRNQPVSVPRIVFTELILRDLRRDPDTPNIDELPYLNIEHLRDCLRELRNEYSKPTKTVIRQGGDLLYRTIRGGFYAGDQTGLKYFPMPTREELDSTHYVWWRSALASFGR